MTEIVAVVLDNAMESQNQDYFPSRFLVQRDILLSIVSRVTEASIENKLGIFPIAQDINNDIVTPTSEKQQLHNFIYKSDLNEKKNHSLALFQVDQALDLSEISSKYLFMFLSSPIQDQGKLLFELNNIAAKGVEIRVICFGDALDFGSIILEAIDVTNCKVCMVQQKEDFEAVVRDFLVSEFEEDDADLQEALRLSRLTN